jgi:hypothetical protein
MKKCLELNINNIKIKDMKKIILLLLSTLILNGCDENKNLKDTDYIQTFVINLQSTATEIPENMTLPEWLLVKINEMEDQLSEDIPIVKVQIFCGRWENKTVFLIMNNLSSCFLCEIYYDNGEKIVLNENRLEEFCTKSENWILVYLFGEGL